MPKHLATAGSRTRPKQRHSRQKQAQAFTQAQAISTEQISETWAEQYGPTNSALRAIPFP